MERNVDYKQALTRKRLLTGKIKMAGNGCGVITLLTNTKLLTKVSQIIMGTKMKNVLPYLALRRNGMTRLVSPSSTTFVKNAQLEVVTVAVLAKI
jgi:hypothetical protein